MRMGGVVRRPILVLPALADVPSVPSLGVGLAIGSGVRELET
jgi:hypothetical protein